MVECPTGSFATLESAGMFLGRTGNEDWFSLFQRRKRSACGEPIVDWRGFGEMRLFCTFGGSRVRGDRGIVLFAAVIAFVIWTTDKVSFSQAAADFFIQEGVNVVFLFYSRLVSEELFARVPVVNCHPSLLPAFSGFKALERTFAAGSRFIGATSHIVNGSTDAGQILVQAAYPIPSNSKSRDTISFVQRVLVTLVCADHLISGNCRIDPVEQRGDWVCPPRSSLSVNPTFLSEGLMKNFHEFQERFGSVNMWVAPVGSECADTGAVVVRDIRSET